MDGGKKRSEVWSALLPSRGRHNHVEMVVGSNCELVSSGSSVSTSSMAMEAGAARWNPKLKSARHYHHHPVTEMPRPVVEHRRGWGSSNPHPEARPAWSEMTLDQMMAMYESQITDDHVFAANESSSGTDLGQTAALSTGGVKLKLEGTSSDLKRKRMELAMCEEEADLGECGWSHPLKLLVRKGLSVSDVGDLGRVIIPKKCAESKFQHLEAKEGTLLEMEDYDGSKRWLFRFKWWTNNKSRMYVLENTGEFIKYHSLKEHDIFAVYEDNVKRLVVRGHKGTDFHSVLGDDVQGSNYGSSTNREESSVLI